jgi:hypothetical protein
MINNQKAVTKEKLLWTLYDESICWRKDYGTGTGIGSGSGTNTVLVLWAKTQK